MIHRTNFRISPSTKLKLDNHLKKNCVTNVFTSKNTAINFNIFNLYFASNSFTGLLKCMFCTISTRKPHASLKYAQYIKFADICCLQLLQQTAL